MTTFARLRPSIIVGVVLLVTVGALAACGANATPAGGGSPVGLSIQDAFARPAPAGGAGGAFLTVVNSGATADRLISARSPVAPVTELHETIDDNGVMKMRPVAGGFEVPPNGKLELKPGGKHVMFMGLTTPLTAGNDIEITLVFEKAGEKTIKVPVRSQ